MPSAELLSMMGCCNAKPVEEEEEVREVTPETKSRKYGRHRSIEITQTALPSPIENSMDDDLGSACFQSTWLNIMIPGFHHTDNKTRCTEIFWLPDCSQSRMEFLRHHNIDMSSYETESDFRHDMIKRKLPNSVANFDDYKRLKAITVTKIWKTLPNRFMVETHIGDSFKTTKGDSMRTYRISGRNLCDTHKAFVFYKDSLEKSIRFQMVTHHSASFEKGITGNTSLARRTCALHTRAKRAKEIKETDNSGKRSRNR